MTAEFKVALIRAVITAIVIGAMAFMATWSQTDDVKTIVIATLTPMVGVLAARFGVEGLIDTKAGAKPTP